PAARGAGGAGDAADRGGGGGGGDALQLADTAAGANRWRGGAGVSGDREAARRGSGRAARAVRRGVVDFISRDREQRAGCNGSAKAVYGNRRGRRTDGCAHRGAAAVHGRDRTGDAVASVAADGAGPRGGGAGGAPSGSLGCAVSE